MCKAQGDLFSMDSQQLQTIMKTDRIGRFYFRGVFASDELKKQMVASYPSAYIVNTDPSYNPGEHWVAVYFNHLGRAKFFCSYGESPKTYDFEKWIQKNSTSWIYHKTRLQGDLSSVCGQYCLFFLLHRLREISIKDFFTQDIDLNDSLVNEFIRNRFDLDTKVLDVEFFLKQMAKSLMAR